MIGIIDYGVGNLFSLRSSLQYIGKQVVVASSEKQLAGCSHLILPGVGAFADAVAKLHQSGLDTVVRQCAGQSMPVLGICLGMQMLFDVSYEYGQHEGLGLIRGKVVPIALQVDPSLKIPHIGWNALHFPTDRPKSPLFRNTPEGTFVYFVHSYYATDCAPSVIATTEYGISLTAAVSDKNVFGTQFHPEKSGDAGLEMLRAFCEI